jgi:Glycosyl transferase family 2
MESMCMQNFYVGGHVDVPKVDASIRKSGDHRPTNDAASVEVSVVIPCLNEADTLEVCITKAKRALRAHHIRGEIIVADNGSTDGSQQPPAWARGSSPWPPRATTTP